MFGSTIPVVVALIVKLLAILGLILYAVFAGVMVRQENLMASVLEEGFEPVIRILTYLHLAAALGLILLAFFIL